MKFQRLCNRAQSSGSLHRKIIFPFLILNYNFIKWGGESIIICSSSIYLLMCCKSFQIKSSIFTKRRSTKINTTPIDTCQFTIYMDAYYLYLEQIILWTIYLSTILWGEKPIQVISKLRSGVNAYI